MSLSEPAARNCAAGLDRIGLGAKILYGLGAIPGSTRQVVFGLFLLFFYTTVMGLPGSLVGVALAIGLIWNAVVDPYIGHRSDRSASSFGRRHGYMLVGTLTLGLSFWALFSPPRGLSTPALFAWLLITSLLVRLTTSIFHIPFQALGAELSTDYHERNAISGVRTICALVGVVGVASLSFVVFFPNRVPGVDPKLNYAAYPTMGLALAGLMTLGALISTLSTMRYRPYLPSVPTFVGTLPTFLDGFRIALSQRSFRVLLISASLTSLGIVINGALFVHFLTYYVQITASRALSTLQLALYGAAVLSIPLWMRVSRRVEKRRLVFVGTLVAAVLMVAARMLVGPGRPFGTGDVRPLLVGEALAGVFASLIWILPASMIADVADEDELQGGQRREGAFFGISSLGDQIASGVGVLLTGVLIDRFAGLVPGQAAQSPLTVERIGLLYSFLPAGLLVIAAFLILRYPLDRAQVAAIQRQLRDEEAEAGHPSQAVPPARWD